MERNRPPTSFEDRDDAGHALAERLREYAGRRDVVVVGLPRGGVPVAAVVARALDAPLDLALVRKLGVPGHPEYAMGAIASGGVVGVDSAVVELLGIAPADVAAVVETERAELARRERAYRREHPALELAGKTVIAVDDGVATGWTMRAVIRALRERGPAEIVAATPVAAAEARRELEQLADRCVCVHVPAELHAVGMHYRDFTPTSDAEVIAHLDAARARAR